MVHEAGGDGKKMMQIPLEDWVRQIITETVQQHSSHCPVRTIVEGDKSNKSNSLVVRVDRIERALSLACWLITPVYIAGIGFMVTAIIRHFGK
jgi:hypothetical protein